MLKEKKNTKKMACERVDISVLVVDDDETSLAIVASVLNSLEYKVLTANGAHNALETLREFEGFFDLVIVELHISEMNGFEFQKFVKNEFQIPVIMMSADSRKSVVSTSLENGAAHYIMKPFCQDDFKDIWQYATVARKGKEESENEGKSQPDDKINFQNVNYCAASLTSEPRRKRKYGQRNKELGQNDESSRLVKKPKVVWTTYLHNLFLLAIKQIGLDRAVPKRILEIMNVPNLTRENVASHLQKYRIFLRKVAEKGLLEGLSDRTLRSRFASGLSALMIKDIQTKNQKLHVPVQQYLKRFAHQTENGRLANAVKFSNQLPRNAYVTSSLGRGHQFPYSLHKGLNLMLQNQHEDSLHQARLGLQSSFEANVGANNIQQKMFGGYENPPYHAKTFNNAGGFFPTYGIMGHGIMTSANGLIGGFKYGGQLIYQNYGSLGNHHNFSYAQGNWNMGSLNNSSNLPWTTYTNNPSSNIQLNGESHMVGTGIKRGFNSVGGAMNSILNNNRCGLTKGITHNANMNVAPFGHGNFGLAQGGFTSASTNAGDGWSNELPLSLITNNGTRTENISGIPKQLDGNVTQNENQYNATSTSTLDKVSHQEDDLSEIFQMLDEMNALNETEESLNPSEFLKPNISSSPHVVQSPEQCNRAGDVTVNSTESSFNLPNEYPTGSDENSNQLPDDDVFADIEPFEKYIMDNGSSASDLTTEQDWDMEIIEALFGAEA